MGVSYELLYVLCGSTCGESHRAAQVEDRSEREEEEGRGRKRKEEELG